MKLKITYITLVFFCFCSNVFAQKVVDSLKGKSFRELYLSYYYSDNDSIKNFYTDVFLNKAKNEKSLSNILEGYYMKVNIYNDERKLRYSDSIISISKEDSNIYFPTLAYYAKAYFFYNKRDFNKSFDNAISALVFAKKHDDKFNISNCNHLIGLLKSRMGENRKAIDVLKKNYEYILQNEINQNALPTIFAISNSYVELGEIDSAAVYNSLGYNKSKNNLEYRNYFRLNSGVINYYKRNLSSALDSINKSMPLLLKIDDKPNLSIGHFYSAKIYDIKNNEDEKIFHLKKIDTIFQEIQDLHPKIKGAYEMLISHYEKKNYYEEQLYYVNRLIRLDSILHSNELYINKSLIEKYDMPKLISEKQLIIENINSKNKKKSYYIVSLVILIFIVLTLLIYQNEKRKKYKKRFYEIYNKDIQSLKPEDNNLKSLDTKKELSLPKKVINNILRNLENFEKENLFLSSEITSNKLASELGTNVKYLSQVINYYKHNSFINYINGLRINYAINKLKQDENFKKYTIIAIANEVGFKKSESFSKAFKKQTNITPSFFIKELLKA